MFEYHNNILCVQANWLYNKSKVISRNNYRVLTQRGWLNVIRRGGNGRTALVAYESIPERFKKVITANFGDPRKTTDKKTLFEQYLNTDIVAADFFNKYTLDNGSSLPDKNKREYLANTMVLNALHQTINDTKSVRGKINLVWNSVTQQIQELPKHSYPHTLPKNVRSLKRKYKDYMERGYTVLIHKNFCNKNSEKINDNAKVWVISRWADRVAVCTNMAQLLFEYNAMAKEKGWESLKEEKTLYKYLNKEGVKHLWYGHRYGDAASKEKFVYQHSTKLPTMRDSLWYSDGTKLNYFYLDENGNVATCQVYEVMDAYSEVFLGFHISKSEDYVAQYKAYKMAVQVSEHRPYQVGFDGQGGHKKLKAGNFLTKLARLAIKTKPYNGKSKTIESAFGRFQSQFMKQDWFFTGQNITAKKQESKVHREFINANKKELPTLEQVKEVYAKRRREWNEAVHPKTGVPRIEMYRSSENPNTSKINIWDMVNLFWVLREKPIKCNAYGISFTEQKQKYTYVVYRDDNLPDVEWLKNNIDKKLYIKFDPENMSSIYLYEKDALGLRFVAEARTKIEIHRAKQEQESWENKYYQNIEKLNKASRMATDEKMDDMLESQGRLPEQYGLHSPSLLGLKGKCKKVANNVGKLQKKESNITMLSDADFENLDVELVETVATEDEDNDINIYKKISKTTRY